jgi:putative membrane protein
MSREAENALLLLVGVATAMITIGGAYTRYVKASLLPWLTVTAVILIGLALVSMAADIRRGSAPDDVHGDHTHRGSIAWLLLVPIVVLIFITPPALRPGAAAPTVTAVSTEVLRRPFPPLPDGRAPEVSVPDVMIRAAQDTAGTLNDRLITVIGFTLPEADGVDLGRVVIICCAADGQLARIHLRGSTAAELRNYPEETWLRVEGTVIPGEANGDSTSIPTLQVESATRIEAPANAYA